MHHRYTPPALAFALWVAAAAAAVAQGGAGAGARPADRDPWSAAGELQRRGGAESDTPPQVLRFAARERVDVPAAVHAFEKAGGLALRPARAIASVGASDHGEHLRYAQLGPGGYPIFGAEVVFHVRDGRVASATTARGAVAAAAPALPDAPAVSVSPARAGAIARAALPAKRYRPASALDATALVYVPRELVAGAELVLAHRVDVYTDAPLGRSYVYVAAADGEVVAVENRMHAHAPTAVAYAGSALDTAAADTTAPATTLYSGEVAITTSPADTGGYRLFRNGGPERAPVHTRDLGHGVGPAFVEFVDADNVWTDSVAPHSPASRDAHWGAERFDEMLRAVLGYNSIDDAGYPLIANVHFGEQYDNARWDGESAYFGDGDPNHAMSRPLTSVDIVAHEFAHGITTFSAGLVYTAESGALNEGYSDIYGAATQRFAGAPPDEAYRIGGPASSDGLGLRSLADPASRGKPDTYEGEMWSGSGNVHVNSGPLGHWYYLLSEGGAGESDGGYAYAVEAIGWRDALAVAHETLTGYLGALSDYEDAANFSMVAAIDLFGACDDRTAAVAEAWRAVGLEVSSLTDGVDFFADRTFVCDTAEAVVFRGRAVGGTGTWDFGDGATAEGLTVTHRYAPGTYSVAFRGRDCAGATELVARPDYLAVDPDAVTCDTFVLARGGSRTLRQCSGALLDPGGLQYYPNRTESEIVVLDPAGASAGFQLEIQEFDTEYLYDTVTLYEIADGRRRRLGAYSGDALEVGQSITTEGEGFAVAFRADASQQRNGFRIGFATRGTVSPPVAALSVPGADSDANVDADAAAATPHFPLTLVGSGRHGIVSYAFGDGGTADGTAAVDGGGADTVTHAYAEPGTYAASQVVRGCDRADTATLRVVVDAGGRACPSLDTLYAELLAGDSVTLDYPVRNCGEVGLRLSPRPPKADSASVSEVAYDGAAAVTAHRITVAPPAGEIVDARVGLVYSGDFDGEEEYVSIAIEGGVPVDLTDDGDPANGTELSATFPLDAEALARALADGVLEVEVANSPDVSYGLGGLDLHRVSFDFELRGRRSLSFASTAPVAPGEVRAASVPVYGEGLAPGTHRYTEEVLTNDPTLPGGILAVPVVVTVVGEPRVRAAPPVIDLGEVDAGRPSTATTTLESYGTGQVDLRDWRGSDPGLALVTPLASQLPRGETQAITIAKTPLTAGDFADTLVILSNAAPLRIVVTGTARATAIAAVAEAHLRDTVAAGRVLTSFATVYNHGLAPLLLSPSVPEAQGYLAWAKLTSDGTVVAPGDSLALPYKVDASARTPGTYSGELRLATSDPLRPVLALTSELTVVGLPAPGIVVEEDHCGATVAFAPETASAAETHRWTFGDGGASREASPRHTYVNSGAYLITYEACNPAGCATVERYVDVDVDCAPYVLDGRGDQTADVCNGRLYDSGGATGSYVGGERDRFSIHAGQGQRILLTAHTLTLAREDVVEVFDGGSSHAPLLIRWAGSDERPGDGQSVVSSGTDVLIRWSSAAQSAGGDLRIDWSCKRTTSTASVDDVDFDVYPNPARAYATVELPARAVELRLVDPTGRTVYRGEASGLRERIDLAPLARGLYGVHVITRDGERLVRRIVVE